MKLLEKLCRLHDAITDSAYLLSTLGLALMVLIYCTEVVTRYFLNSPLDWANDTFANILCVTIFAMLPHATRVAAHIEISLLPELLPALRRPLAMWVAIAGAAVCGLAAWMSLHENFRQVAMGILTLQNHAIPVVWMTSFITYGFASASLYFFRNLLPEVARPKSWVVTISKNATTANT